MESVLNKWNASLLILAFALAGTSQSVYCQESEPRFVADTSSPRSTLKSFLDSCNEFQKIIEDKKYVDRQDDAFRPIANRILDCMDVSQLPAFAREERAGEVAICMKEILDRVELPPWEEKGSWGNK